jgi:hypothetical protein
MYFIVETAQRKHLVQWHTHKASKNVYKKKEGKCKERKQAVNFISTTVLELFSWEKNKKYKGGKEIRKRIKSQMPSFFYSLFHSSSLNGNLHITSPYPLSLGPAHRF